MTARDYRQHHPRGHREEEAHSVRFTVTLTPTEHEQLIEAMKDTGMDRMDFIRQAIMNEVQRRRRLPYTDSAVKPLLSPGERKTALARTDPAPQYTIIPKELPPTAEQLEEIKQLRQQGYNAGRIALRLGLGLQQVMDVLGK